MIFEGTEKKVEIIVSDRGESLRSLGHGFWKEIVSSAQATVLSTLTNERMDAYLLSESSLFVLDDRMVMITCGKTNLAHATGAFIDKIGAQRVSYLVYERKNENFPHLQPTSFEDDIREIESRIPGTTTFFGEKNEHYLSLFASTRDYTPVANDTTVEILMYDLAPGVRQSFQGQQIPQLELADILPGYTIDDHIFTPCGYSLNALRDACYYTIHITPEEHGSYASFESNICVSAIDMEDLVRSVANRFSPDRFDLVVFDCPDTAENKIRLPDYSMFIADCKNIGSSYNVQFLHFRKIR
jgi:S-adenosylmethionine decarboxylase